MGFKCGIVGLPNVGKSTLFNALTETSNAQAENYPFCTIDPNVGEVAIPDDRLKALARISDSKSIIPTKMSFILPIACIFTPSSCNLCKTVGLEIGIE